MEGWMDGQINDVDGLMYEWMDDEDGCIDRWVDRQGYGCTGGCKDEKDDAGKWMDRQMAKSLMWMTGWVIAWADE